MNESRHPELSAIHVSVRLQMIWEDSVFYVETRIVNLSEGFGKKLTPDHILEQETPNLRDKSYLSRLKITYAEIV